MSGVGKFIIINSRFTKALLTATRGHWEEYALALLRAAQFLVYRILVLDSWYNYAALNDAVKIYDVTSTLYIEPPSFKKALVELKAESPTVFSLYAFSRFLSVFSWQERCFRYS